jgi:hypothetical protein
MSRFLLFWLLLVLGYLLKNASCLVGRLTLLKEGISLSGSVGTVLFKSANCRKPPRYIPYKGTYVPYDGTYGASDQGQTLDVWGSQTAESALT